MEKRIVDNLIIGAGLVGSLTARVLALQGESGVLLERSPDAGGVNGSFRDSKGNWFDHGRHIINYDRSEFTRDFVNDVLKGEVRRFNLERSVVVRGHIIPYAADLDEWPDEFRKHIHIDPAAGIRLGSSREEFARAYGPWLADLAFDEMIRAYPPLVWQREQGIPETDLMRWIFPWFFPRSAVELPPEPGMERGVYSEESRLYHYKTRHSDPPCEEVMYPLEGGFGRLIRAMLDGCRDHFAMYMGADDIHIDMDPDSLRVNGVISGGIEYRAERVFWCIPLPVLCRYAGWTLPPGEPQWELLGSFTFRDPVRLQDHEVLFADPEYRIRRINNPGRIAGQDESTTLQVEYTTLGDEAHEPESAWRDRWLGDLQRLGFVDKSNPVREFDFRALSRGIVSTEDLSGFLEDCKSRIADANSNLIAPHLAVASDNNCRLIPEVFQRIDRVLWDN
ncbi:MAG: NAD(P)-binding protein [Gammaproteobacteria bacterium]